MTNKELANAVRKYKGKVNGSVLSRHDTVYLPIVKKDFVDMLLENPNSPAAWELDTTSSDFEAYLDKV